MCALEMMQALCGRKSSTCQDADQGLAKPRGNWVWSWVTQEEGKLRMAQPGGDGLDFI